MKILQLCTSLSFAGAEQVILDLCSMSDHIFVIAGLQEGDNHFAVKAQQANIPTFNLSMTNKFDLKVISRLNKLIDNENIDLIHSHLVHANFIGRLTASKTNVPIISTIHIVEKRFRPTHKWMELLTANKTNCITTVSQCVFDHAKNNIGLPKNKLCLIPNGIDTERFKPNIDIMRDIDILILGRLDRQKGIDLILPTLKKIVNQTPLRCVIVGSGPEEQNLKKQAKELNLAIEWQAFSDKPEEWFKRSKICLIPSRWEGFGLVAAEALSSQCQVLHSGVDSLGSVCGQEAITFSDNNEDWATQVIECHNNFIENTSGRLWIKENFSKRTMLESYKRLYESCVV